MKKLNIWLTIMFLSLVAVDVSAQTSNFTYQGKLSDGGVAANGNYDFEFGLFETLKEESSLYPTVTRNNVAVVNGIFSVEIDFGIVIPVESFLEIRVKRTGEGTLTALAPRQKITTAPYANRSAFSNFALSTNNANFATGAGSLGGFPATDFARTNFVNTFLTDQIFNANLTQSGNNAVFNTVNGFLVTGVGGAGTIPITGNGTRMMFYPSKYAFRAGVVSAGQWDDSNIGPASTAFGINTVASGQSSFAAGNGSESTSFYTAAFNQSRASGLGSLAGGSSSTDGSYSVAIGDRNSAAGASSIALGSLSGTSPAATSAIALGRGAVAVHPGSFVFADFSGNGINSFADNSWTSRASGGFRLFTNSAATTGVQLSAGGGSWTSLSDRHAKYNISSIDSRDILRKVLSLPISTWSYKGQEFRHIGPMAQDFYSIFGVGESERTITGVDPDGIALAAIQGLNGELDDRLKIRDAKIDELQKQINELKQLICAEKPQSPMCR